MHFENLGPESSTNDYNRLVELCGSYGLNEEETNQIISDFKNGSFAQPDQSIDQSFQDSIRNLQYPNHYCDRNSVEEYSFKDKQKLNFRQMVYEKDSVDYEHESEQKNTNNKSLQINDEILETFFNERRQFEQNVYRKLEEENEALKRKLQESQQKMEMLIKIKAQDSQTISGLKNSIVSIANSLDQKDRAYRTLLQKFECLKLENESLSTQKSSKIEQLSHQESVNSIEGRKSIQKQFCLTEIDQNRSSLLVKKQSQKQLKDLNKKTSSSKSIQDENMRASFIKNEAPKRNAVDINKYKGMIEKLRSSYQIK